MAFLRICNFVQYDSSKDFSRQQFHGQFSLRIKKKIPQTNSVFDPGGTPILDLTGCAAQQGVILQ